MARVSSIERTVNTLADLIPSIAGTIADAPGARISLSYGISSSPPSGSTPRTRTIFAARSTLIASVCSCTSILNRSFSFPGLVISSLSSCAIRPATW